jgi:hypothetical protein
MLGQILAAKSVILDASLGGNKEEGSYRLSESDIPDKPRDVVTYPEWLVQDTRLVLQR